MNETPSRAEAQEAAIVAQMALTDAANTLFINDSTAIIEDLINQKKFQVTLNGVKNMSLRYVATYYRDLGYIVKIPVCPFWLNRHKEFWSDFFYTRRICNCSELCKVNISWRIGGPIPPPGIDFLLLENGDFIALEDGSGNITLE